MVSSAVLVIVAVASFGAIVVGAARAFYWQLANIVLALLLQLPVCSMMIPGSGSLAAAWTEVIRNACGCAFLTGAGYLLFIRRRISTINHVPPRDKR
jgi:hypothetical protein